jgi:hypothetical protein
MGRVRTAACFLPVVWLAACAPEGPSAFVTYNIVPTPDCVYTADTTATGKFYPIGRYDIASHGTGGMGTACAHSYFANLLVNSFLRPNSDMMVGRAEPDVLQISTAEVLLTDDTGKVIAFDREKDKLANPFTVRTSVSLFPTLGMLPSTGVASVEAIPKAYAPQLNNWIDKQITARIQLFGTTTGDTDVQFRPFTYPIQICNGCNTRCATSIADGKTRKDYILANTCDDNSGNDDRLCFDPFC